MLIVAYLMLNVKKRLASLCQREWHLHLTLDENQHIPGHGYRGMEAVGANTVCIELIYWDDPLRCLT